MPQLYGRRTPLPSSNVSLSSFISLLLKQLPVDLPGMEDLYLETLQIGR